MNEHQLLISKVNSPSAPSEFIEINLEDKNQDNPIQQKEEQKKTNRSFLQSLVPPFLRNLTSNDDDDYTSDQSKADQEKIDSIYKGMILLRRITRVLMLFTIMGLLIGLFIKGYLITVDKSKWSSNYEIQNINIYVQNCFVNIMQSDNLLQFNSNIKGSLQNQINSFTIEGDIIEQSTANLTFNSPFDEIRNCYIDLQLPINIQNLNIICQTQSICIIAFGMEQLIVDEQFSAKSEEKASLNINIRNIKTKKFAYFSEQSGNLFINNFEIEQANIQQQGGIIALQSTKSFYLNYSSQSHAICSSAFKITEQTNNNCYFKSEEQQFLSQICQGSMNLCQNDSCESQNQIINIIGNQSSIYANILIDIGKPLIKGINQFDIIQSYPFLLGNLSLSNDSKQQISSFLNETYEADIGVRLDVNGHYLLQHSSSTQWAFFSNPQYGAFKPWWLSVFSGSFLNPLFTHIQANLEPGFCPWNPTLTSEQLFNIKNIIQKTFNTSYGEAVFIQRDDYIQQNKTLNENLTYNGFEPLKQKQKGELEDWYLLKQKGDDIQYTSQYYDPYFKAAIALSISSAIIFGFFFVSFGLVKLLEYLNSRALKQSKQFQRFALNISNRKTKNNRNLSNEIEQIDDDDIPPFLGILSYTFYELGQQYLKNARQTFQNQFYKEASLKQTQQFYDGTLDRQFLSIDVDELNELYLQFCFMNKLKFIPLRDDFECYGFRFLEKENPIIFTKIKLNLDAKPYNELSETEKLHSQSSLQLFFSTQCFLTGIQQDEIPAQLLEEKYIEFCEDQLKVEQFDIREICQQYGLKISDKLLQELRKRDHNDIQQDKNNFVIPLYLQNKEADNEPLIINETNFKFYKIKIINRLNNLKAFQLNPIEEINKRLTDFQLNQTSFCQIFYYTINYQCSFLNNCDWFKVAYDENNEYLIDYFNTIYIEGWLISDAVVVIGNFIFSIFFIVPYLFFLVIMNTYYTPYSVYNPKSMLSNEDMFYRPWILVDYLPFFDDWAIGIISIILFYEFISFSLQTLKYAFSYFPNEVEYIWELKTQKNFKVLSFFNLFWFFLFTYFALGFLVYFGLIIVWLLLGAIINPNQYLVYSSSALSLVSFIYAQVSQAQEMYFQAKKEINNIINNILSQLFSQTVGPIIKEIQRLSDQSIQIINSSVMEEAKKVASNLGFEEELQELCVSTQVLVEDGTCTDINQEKLNFKQIKNKFLEKAKSNFIKMAKEQFKIPKMMAELFVRINFSKFEDIYEIFAEQISLCTNKKVPASIFKWIEMNLNFLDSTNQNQMKDVQSQKSLNYFLDILIDLSQDQLKQNKQRVNSDESESQSSKIIILKSYLNLIYHIHKMNQQNINNISENSKTIIIQLVRKFIENIKEIETLNSNQINTSMYILDFILSHINDDAKTRESKGGDLIENLLEIQGYDRNVLKFIEFIFSKNDYFLTMDDNPLTLMDQYNIQQIIIKGWPEKDEYLENIMIGQVALKSIKRNIPSFAEIYQLVSTNFKQKKNDSQQSNELMSKKYKEKFHFWYLLLQFALKDWQTELDTQSLGLNQQFFLQILPVSCKNLWSSNFLLKQNNTKGESRKKYLKNNPLVQSIARGLQISEDSTIGLILILRNEIFSSVYHKAIYQIFTPKKSIENQSYEEYDKLIRLLSMVNFENIFNFLLLYFSNSELIIEYFLNIVFSSRTMFEIFNGYSIMKIIYQEDRQIIDPQKFENLIQRLFQDNKKQSKKESKKQHQDQQKNKGKKNQFNFEQFIQSKVFLQKHQEINFEVLNYYKSSRVTFYTFLNKQVNHELQLSKEKSNFYKKIQDKVILDEYGLQIILQHQQCLLQNSDFNEGQFKNQRWNLEINKQAYRNLLQLMLFDELKPVIKALNYFQQFNSQKNINSVTHAVKQKLQKLIELEQAIIQFQQLSIIPFELNQLQNSIINEIFKTQINLNQSNLNNIIYFITQKYNQTKEKIGENVEAKYNLRQEFYNLENNNQQSLIQFSEIFTQIFIQLESYPQNIRQQKLAQILSQFSGTNDGQQQQFMDLILSFKNLKNKEYTEIFNKIVELIKMKTPLQWMQRFLIDYIKTIKNLTTVDKSQTEQIDLTQYLKYIFSIDLDSYSLFINQYIENKITRKEDQCNANIIISVFSIMTEKPDYSILKICFDFDEQHIKLVKFIQNAMSKRKKLQLVKENQSTIKEYFDKNSVNHLMWLTQILEYDVIEPADLLKYLNLDQNNQVKIFEQFYYLKRQIYYQKKWSDMQQQYNQLADKRLQKVYKESEYYSKIKLVGNIPQILIFEMLNWFSHPRPTSFQFLNGKFNLLDEKTAILFSIIGSIGKYDWSDTYQSIDPEKIYLKTKELSQLINKTLQDKIRFIIKTSDCNLEETFLLLYVLTGIDPSITCAIFQNSLNENHFLKIVLSGYSDLNQQQFTEFLNVLKTIEKNFELSNVLSLINYEAQKSQKIIQQSNCFANLPISQDDYATIQTFMRKLHQENKVKSFPFSSLALIYGLKFIRSIKKQKNQLIEKQNIGQFLIDFVISAYEITLPDDDASKNFLTQNKDYLVKLLTQGIFDSNKLRKSQNTKISLGQINQSGQLIEKDFKFFKITDEQNSNPDSLQQKNYDVMEIWQQKKNLLSFVFLVQGENQNNLAGQLLSNLFESINILDFKQVGYIKSKYWIKSIDLLKKQKINVGKYESKQNQQQILFVDLLQYYARNVPLKGFQVRIDTIKLIEKLIQTQSQQNSIQELELLYKILYDSDNLNFEQLNRIWKDDQVIMESILIMLLRNQFNSFKRQGKYYNFIQMMHYKLLFQFQEDYNYAKQFNEGQQNNFQALIKQMNLGIEKLIQQSQKIKKKVQYIQIVNQLIRCYLGEIDAWSEILYNSELQDKKLTKNKEDNKVDNKEDNKEDNEKFIKIFIKDFLKQIMMFNLKNQHELGEKIEQRSFYQLIKYLENGKNVFFEVINKSLQAALDISGYKIKGNFMDELKKFIEFILNKSCRMNQNNFDQISKTIYIIETIFQFEKSNATKQAIQFLIHLYFDQNQLFEKDGEVLNYILKKIQASDDQIEKLGEDRCKQLIQKILEMQQLYPLQNFQNNILKIIEQNHLDQLLEKHQIFSQSLQQFQNLLDNFKKKQNLINSIGLLLFQIQFLDNQKVDPSLKQNFENEQAMLQIIFSETQISNQKIFGEKKLKMVDFFFFLIDFHQDQDLKQLKEFIKENLKIDDEYKLPSDFDKFIKSIVNIKNECLIKVLDIYINQKKIDINFFQSVSALVPDLKILIDFQISKLLSIDDPPIIFNKKLKSEDVGIIKKIMDQYLTIEQLLSQLSNPQAFSKQEFVTTISEVFKGIHKDYSLLMYCINTFFALKNRSFQEIPPQFFEKVFQKTNQESLNLIQNMINFQKGLQAPQLLIKERLSSLSNQNNKKVQQIMNPVLSKLTENKELSIEDMFKILDKNAQKIIKSKDIFEFLRRLGIVITEQKFREILVVVKQGQFDINNCQIDVNEFKQIMQELSEFIIFQSLEKLGISNSDLIIGLVWFIFYMIIVLVFILIGVQAFAAPGTLAVLVNSALPMIGGLGLNKLGSENKFKVPELKAFEEIVRKILLTYQNIID